MSHDETRIAELHRSAMRLAREAADLADPELAASLLSLAFKEEREAATLLATALDLEPTRAILHRSATSLGMRCQQMRAAYEVLMSGLASRSPEVKGELRELQEELDRHLVAEMNAAEVRRHLERTWSSRDWRERVPEILSAYLGKMDRFLELNGASAQEAKEIVLVALARLHASDVRLLGIAEFDLALFDLLHQLWVERQTNRDRGRRD
jgi:hypothetical protein